MSPAGVLRLALLAASAAAGPLKAQPDTLRVTARADSDRLEVLREGRWVPFYVKGVDLGAALPGRYATEFPSRAVYDSWIAEIARLGANTIRVYTIHSPDLYAALAAWDRAHPQRPLWLLQGVWYELPPRYDFDDPAWLGDLDAEMRRAVDVVHGSAVIAPHFGHASGSYRADVSAWTLGFVVGRELEPYAIDAYDRAHRGLTSWNGRFLTLAGGTAADVWLARVLERMVAYETGKYRAQRPVAYTSWPTLDPLRHPTESTLAEERAMLRSRGLEVADPPMEHDEDTVQVDPTLLRPTAAFRAGVFAVYHAYPYYPDFMVLDPGYTAARSPWGRSSYFGYLRALKARHAGMPVVIGEYGVAASLGAAHLQPQGWNHGGHTETAMAGITARLTREIAAAGMAGGIVFEWIDEWFKRNWMVMGFELPADRKRLWLNRLDPEEMYGLVAMEPARILPGSTLADRLAAWRRLPLLGGSAGAFRVRATADAAQLWILVEPVGRATLEDLYVGFDVVRPEAGEFRWPERRGPALPVGVEFALHLAGHEARLMAEPEVNPFRLRPTAVLSDAPPRVPAIDDAPPGFFTGRFEQVTNPPFISRRREDGVYAALRVLTNRPRFGRDRSEYAGLGYDRGLLPEGEPPDGVWSRDSASGAVEIRVPWLLINVTDPSSRRVLDGADSASARTTAVRDIGLVVAAPQPGGAWPMAAARFGWPGWNEPRWQARARPVYDSLRAVFAELKDEP